MFDVSTKQFLKWSTDFEKSLLALIFGACKMWIAEVATDSGTIFVPSLVFRDISWNYKGIIPEFSVPSQTSIRHIPTKENTRYLW